MTLAVSERCEVLIQSELEVAKKRTKFNGTAVYGAVNMDDLEIKCDAYGGQQFLKIIKELQGIIWGQ